MLGTTESIMGNTGYTKRHKEALTLRNCFLISMIKKEPGIFLFLKLSLQSESFLEEYTLVQLKKKR